MQIVWLEGLFSVVDMLFGCQIIHLEDTHVCGVIIGFLTVLDLISTLLIIVQGCLLSIFVSAYTKLSLSKCQTMWLFQQVLGTPTREEIKCMNPNYTEFKFPQIKAHPWHKVSGIIRPYVVWIKK